MNAKNNKENGFNVIENKVIECEVTEESRKAYGRPSVNEEKDWKLDHVIPFDFYHNAYIKSRASIDELLEESEQTPDEENDSLSGCWIGDGIELQHEAFWVADDCVPHTFDEFKAEQIRTGYWEGMLKVEGMTEEEFKADYIKRYAQDNAA